MAEKSKRAYVQRLANHARYERMRPYIAIASFAFVALAALAMACLMGIGIFNIFAAMVRYTFELPQQPAGEGGATLTSSATLLVTVMKGVELLFLAPLPFLLMLGIARYADDALCGEASEAARSQLRTVKIFAATLLISVTTVQAVLEIVEGRFDTFLHFLPGLLLILALSIYLAVLSFVRE